MSHWNVIESQKNTDKKARGAFTREDKGKDDRKKYCLDYNKGTCRMQGSHEGILSGVVVYKHHICKKCLIEDNSERYHPSKDCPKK